ncbi:MAG: tRNA (guanosine(37)-N1)-methyltransferase TrmD [Deltaproteobacteria bacterium]|nr:tRNA (guanosine(37)-N1)-methyltransferase TrmD [Candidatus Zymogenaceae bacterium]
MLIDILTIFPDYFESPFGIGLIKKAIDAGLISIRLVDIRHFSASRHNQVDDCPFGGGAGMVMKPEPIFRAIRHIGRGGGYKPRVILLSPQGIRFTQDRAVQLAGLKRIAFICGRYEGVDERVSEGLVDEELSIGDYVLSGGEAAALVIIEALSRQIPGVVGNKESVSGDTFYGKFLKYPQYTRPQHYLGMSAPPVLVSGDHGKIEDWRMNQSVSRTVQRRPDLIDHGTLSESERKIVDKVNRTAGEKKRLRVLNDEKLPEGS